MQAIIDRSRDVYRANSGASVYIICGVAERSDIDGLHRLVAMLGVKITR